MGNGDPEILAMADLVTDDVEADGLYKAFDKLGLLQYKKLSYLGNSVYVLCWFTTDKFFQEI